MERQMYGSTHTHFEDLFDTGNDKKNMVLLFHSLGAKKVALTGHGSMFAYEDLKEIVAHFKETKEIDGDFEVIPGVEVYFESGEKENGDKKIGHMVLVAKDYEGYRQLCKVITDAAKNTKASRSSIEEQEYLTPIVTLENLKKNIAEPGHVYATSACVGGVFAGDLGGDEIYRYKKNMDKKTDAVKDMEEEYNEASAFLEEWDYRTADKSIKKLTKKETEKLQKAIQDGDEEVANALLLKQTKAEELDAWKNEHKKEREAAKKRVSSYETALAAAESAERALAEYIGKEGERFAQMKELYFALESVFGKEDFYFELQNHGLLQEDKVYNNIVKLAYEVGNPHFIASNDVHIGDRKGSDTWDRSVTRRRVEMFNRFKNIYRSDDEEEYGIKTDAELREELLKIVKPFTDKDGVTHSPEEIVSAAIDGIESALSECHVEFPEISLDGTNFYPKFCENEAEAFKQAVEAGIAERFPNGLPEEYRERIDYETSVIEDMGFCGYHLIVKDYVEYGRLLGYLRTEEEIANAPLSIEGLNKYIDDNNIPRVGMGVGPGRGSAAGCLCAYLLGITDVDPIKYGLMFERFLNPSRRSMPDIDSDFKDDIRDRLYQYIEARYGEENVSKVCTKAEAHGKAAAGIASRYLTALEGEGKTKPEQAAIKDAYGKALKDVSASITKYMKEHDLSAVKVENGTRAAREILKARLAERDAEQVKLDEKLLKIDEELLDVRKSIEERSGQEMTNQQRKDWLDPLKEQENKLVAKRKNLVDDHNANFLGDFERETKVLQMVDTIAGIPSNISMHACACLISGTPLSDVIPLAWNDAKQKMTTQCLYPQAEELGLLKMDLLNIKNLSVITRVMQEANAIGQDDLLRTREGIQKMLEDKKIFDEIFCTGRTGGIFQFESDGMTDMVKKFQPRCFEDIIILVAAYRPGPIDFIPEIIAEKWYNEVGEASPHGKPVHKINIDNEKLKNILAPTYGVPIYQEQIMKIVQELAGYNMADADNVRKYMSKKKTALLEKERGFFVHGSDWVIEDTRKKITALREKEHPTEEDLKEANKLEAEMNKMPTYIKGCVPGGICTEKEANALFDAMMEFGKYAFNKSHAMCYAQVAMMTAYQKLYFPELFYKYTLSNETKDGPSQKDKRQASEKYLGEMASFGIEMLPPSASASLGDWKNENGKMRMGFGCIKGCHYKDYRNAEDIFSFLLRNYDISIAQVQIFVKLGMFDQVYPCKNEEGKEVEKARVCGNRRAMEEWVANYGEEVKEFGRLQAEFQTLANELAIAKAEAASGNTALNEVIETMSNRHIQLNAILTDKQAFFKELRKNDVSYRTPTKQEQIADRAYEYEKMGVVFSAKKDLEKLSAKGGITFKDIEEARDRNNKYGDTARVAATVVGKVEMPPGRGPKWKITLMDKDGNTCQVGSFDKVDPVFDTTCGMFDISYGMYLSLKGVFPLEETAEKTTTDRSQFDKDRPVEKRKHLLEDRDIFFQNKGFVFTEDEAAEKEEEGILIEEN